MKEKGFKLSCFAVRKRTFLTMSLALCLMPARVEPHSGITSAVESLVSAQLTNEGLFFFSGSTRVFAPLTPDTLARIPRQLREGIGARLILLMAATPSIIKASSLLFAGARAQFWGGHLWNTLRDEWHGVINKAIPVLLDNPLLQQRLFIRFVHEQGNSRWEVLRIPGVFLSADQEQKLNPLDWVLYYLWSIMDNRRLDRLELRWDVEGKGWFSEFNRDKKTRVFWPEVMHTTLEEELVAGAGLNVQQTLLDPGRLSRLSGASVLSEVPEASAETSPAIEWLQGRFASILSFGDFSETHLVWLKDSAYFSWQDKSLLLMRSGESVDSLMAEVNHPAMAAWQYQSAPLILPPIIAEWLVLETACYLLGITETALSTLTNLGAVKITQQFQNRLHPQAQVKDIDTFSYRNQDNSPAQQWLLLPTSVALSKKPVTSFAVLGSSSFDVKTLPEENGKGKIRQHQGGVSERSSTTREKVEEKESSHGDRSSESPGGKRGVSPDDGGNRRGGEEPPKKPDSFTGLEQRIASEKKGCKRAASGPLKGKPAKRARLNDNVISSDGWFIDLDACLSTLGDDDDEAGMFNGFPFSDPHSLNILGLQDPGEAGGSSNEPVSAEMTDGSLPAVCPLCQDDVLMTGRIDYGTSYEERSETGQTIDARQQLIVEAEQFLLESQQLKQEYSLLSKLLNLVSELMSENESLKNNEQALKAEIDRLTKEKSLADKGQKVESTEGFQTLNAIMPASIGELTDTNVDITVGDNFVLPSTSSEVMEIAPDSPQIVSLPIASWLKTKPVFINPASFEQVMGLAQRLDLPEDWVCIGYKIKHNQGKVVTVKTIKDLNLDYIVTPQEVDEILAEIEANLAIRSPKEKTFLQTLGVREAYRQAEALDVLFSDVTAQIWLASPHHVVENKLQQLQAEDSPKGFSKEELALHRRWNGFKKNYPHVIMENADFDAFCWLSTVAAEIKKKPDDKLAQLVAIWTDFSIHLALEKLKTSRRGKKKMTMPAVPFQWRRL